MKSYFGWHENLPHWLYPIGEGEVILDFHVDALVKADVDIIYIGVKESDAHWLDGFYAKAYKRYRPDFYTRKERTGDFISVHVLLVPDELDIEFEVIEHMIDEINALNSSHGYSFIPNSYLIEIPGSFYDSSSWVSEKGRGLLSSSKHAISMSTKKGVVSRRNYELISLPYSIVMDKHWPFLRNAYRENKPDDLKTMNGLTIKNSFPVPEKGSHAWIKYARHPSQRKRYVQTTPGMFLDLTKYRNYIKFLDRNPYRFGKKAWHNAVNQSAAKKLQAKTGKLSSTAIKSCGEKGNWLSSSKYGFGYTGITLEEYTDALGELIETNERKVVIGKPHFDPSDKLMEEYLFRKDIGYTKINGKFFLDNGDEFIISKKDRENPIFVWLVQAMGEAASKDGSFMKIVKIPFNLKYDIESGEKIVEQHKIYN